MILTNIDSLVESPSLLLSDILAHYFDVDDNLIINYLTEYVIEFTRSLADTNMISTSDMIDVVQRNLSSKVELRVIERRYHEDMILMNTEIAFIDNGRNYTIPLVWCLDS